MDRSGPATGGRSGSPGASQRFTLLATFGAATTFALLLFGSNVTAGGVASALIFRTGHS